MRNTKMWNRSRHPHLPAISFLSDQNRTVSHISFLKLLHRLLYASLSQRELLNDGLDAMKCCKPQHLDMRSTRRADGALEREAISDELHVRKGEGVSGHSERVYLCMRREDIEVAAGDTRLDKRCSHKITGDVLFPFRLLGCCDKEVLEGCPYLELLYVLRRVKLARAEVHCLFPFILCPGEHHDLASHFRSELDSKMSEAANADNTYPIGG